MVLQRPKDIREFAAGNFLNLSVSIFIMLVSLPEYFSDEQLPEKIKAIEQEKNNY